MNASVTPNFRRIMVNKNEWSCDEKFGVWVLTLKDYSHRMAENKVGRYLV